MLERPVLAIVAIVVLAAATVWVRSARQWSRVARRLRAAEDDPAGYGLLARTSYMTDVQVALLFGVVAASLAAGALSDGGWVELVPLLALVPVALTVRFGSAALRRARSFEARSHLEQRAQEVLDQDSLAPMRWSARLAPDEIPAVPGFQFGTLYQAGTGKMAGDFYDVFRTGPTRLVAVIGDVTGHGIEPSISAFQAKYLLRVFLRQYRDPGQALEELNGQLFGVGRAEEFISMCVVAFDTAAATLRYASAGHPPAFIWREGEVQALEATGPLISLDPSADYASREVPLGDGDVVLLYTDGLTEARSGDQLFGEERIAAHLKREAGVDPGVICKSLVEAAEDFATVPISDDIAILAVRRT